MTETLARPAHHRRPQSLLHEVVELRSSIRAEAQRKLAHWGPLQRRAFRLSAANFAAYLAFRRRDLRRLQLDLMPFGLSSFGRSEARVFPSLDAVISSLTAIGGGTPHYPHARSFFRGERLLRRNRNEIFGAEPEGRQTRIMVTLPSEAASEPLLLQRLIAAGTDCVRINCAHDDAAAWKAMAANARNAAAQTGRPCTVCFDLAGPKVRTQDVLVPGDAHRVRLGDRILFVDRLDPASTEFPVQFTGSIPAALAQLETGTPVWINDGKIGCTVEERSRSRAVLRVTHARPKGETLKAEKGLNFPTLALGTSSLTADDEAALEEIAPLADLIGYSFVREPQDVERLQQTLRELDPARPPVPLVLKIETAQAVRNLPELIVASARSNPTAVMIARGDLAVEIEYRRLAEIQEEMLWICEAAHIPVVWATEVLDRFIKDGKPSRAEFTDAAASERADCVMLNKGPFVVEAVEVLSDVLHRMEAHQSKKTHLLRALKSWS
ncbi:MAG: hypothetical protein JO140_02230 [Candidatus Eremiobacteraeota bacterium]|nr:hypothetical protein [Candidatus Eremiobacteraeota bacterium]